MISKWRRQSRATPRSLDNSLRAIPPARFLSSPDAGSPAPPALQIQHEPGDGIERDLGHFAVGNMAAAGNDAAPGLRVDFPDRRLVDFFGMSSVSLCQ